MEKEVQTDMTTKTWVPLDDVENYVNARFPKDSLPIRSCRFLDWSRFLQYAREILPRGLGNVTATLTALNCLAYCTNSREECQEAVTLICRLMSWYKEIHVNITFADYEEEIEEIDTLVLVRWGGQPLYRLLHRAMEIVDSEPLRNFQYAASIYVLLNTYKEDANDQAT